MRFDHRGIGDSDGETTFEHLEIDIRAAIDALQATVTEVEEVVLWGLCDGASAAMMYAPLDDRVKGLVLLNPWIRTEQTLAQAYLKGYYVSRLLDMSFWRRLLRAQVSPAEALRSFWATAHAALAGPSADDRSTKDSVSDEAKEPFPLRMQRGLRYFKEPVLLILSGEDITAQEFDQVTTATPAWRAVLGGDKITTKKLPEADHTFSRKQWSEQVEQWTLDWLRSW